MLKFYETHNFFHKEVFDFQFDTKITLLNFFKIFIFYGF